MSTELYKRFRPKSLERVVGNASTVKALQSMIEKKTVPHAILFSGPSGCGKTTLTRILRTELGCLDVDYCEMNSSSFRGVDTIREIIRTMQLAPTGGKCRVWALDEVHQLTKDAQNAALKMLEDTPDHVYFILATTDPQRLLRTIITRCMHLPVERIRDADMEKLVARVVAKEEINTTADVVDELILAAEGSARLALVLLEKIRGLPPEHQLRAVRKKLEEDREAIVLCRALLKKEKWVKVASILQGIKEEPESVRRSVLGYARAMILKSNDVQAYAVLRAFESNFYDSKAAGLAP